MISSKSTNRPTGMTAFIIVWLGQIVSVLASSMSHFGLTIWMYQQTGSATAMGLMQVAFITPFLILSPIAGVMVDRYNRKLMMMVSDLAAIIATGGIFILLALGRLEFWHLYISAALNGIGNTFQWPAYSAAITTMVPKEQYGRANGLMSLMEAGPGVLAPMLAGALLPLIGLTGLLTIDVLTFFFAIGALLLVFVPQPVHTAEGEAGRGSLLHEAAYGFRYIFQRPSLLGLQLVFFFGNLFSGIGFAVLAPMVLARTASNSVIFGMVESAGAIGGVVGGVAMSAWGGFKRRVHGVLAGWILCSLPFASGGHRPGASALAAGDVLAVAVWSAGEHLEPGHLAGQGGARRAGPGLLGAPADRLAHQSHFAHHRWHAGRLRAGAGHAERERFSFRLRLAGGDRPRRGHGPADRDLRPSRRARARDRLLHSGHP